MPGTRLKTKYVFCFTNRKITALIAGRTSSWGTASWVPAWLPLESEGSSRVGHRRPLTTPSPGRWAGKAGKLPTGLAWAEEGRAPADPRLQPTPEQGGRGEVTQGPAELLCPGMPRNGTSPSSFSSHGPWPRAPPSVPPTLLPPALPTSLAPLGHSPAAHSPSVSPSSPPGPRGPMLTSPAETWPPASGTAVARPRPAGGACPHRPLRPQGARSPPESHRPAAAPPGQPSSLESPGGGVRGSAGNPLRAWEAAEAGPAGGKARERPSPGRWRGEARWPRS